MIVCGVDGCKGGWIAVCQDLASGEINARLCPTAQDIFSPAPSPQVLAIDIPIGLPASGARLCDQQARRLLGRGRASSVFPAPLRPILAAKDYRDACRIRLAIDGKQMSWEAFNIVVKIREIDEALRQDPALQTRVHESHPEVCFYHLAGGRPMQHNKKTAAGRAERFILLEPHFGNGLQDILARRRELASGVDDVLDAFACLWTAGRIAGGRALTLPPDPPRDAYGLRMEIVA